MWHRLLKSFLVEDKNVLIPRSLHLGSIWHQYISSNDMMVLTYLPYNIPVLASEGLKHWGLNKMVNIYPTFSNIFFSGLKIVFEISIKLDWHWHVMHIDVMFIVTLTLVTFQSSFTNTNSCEVWLEQKYILLFPLMSMSEVWSVYWY